MYDDYRERGLEIVTILIEDGNGDGTIDWEDASKYAKDWDGDGTENTDHVPFTVIADYNRILWQTYRHPCSPTDTTCTNSCWVTPQHQLVNQGLATIDDTCSVPQGGTTCSQCGWSTAIEADLRALLDDVLPPKWCGEGTQ